jgi:predicted transcriptional regulator
MVKNPARALCWRASESRVDYAVNSVDSTVNWRDDVINRQFPRFAVHESQRLTSGFPRGFFMMGQHDALDVMEQFNRLEDFRVLVALLKRLDYQNVIVVVQKEIAESLNMHKSQVSRAISRLVSVGAIFKGPRDGQSCMYRLNPNFGWKGSAENHVKALAEYREQRMLEGGREEAATAPELVTEAHQPIRPMRKNRLFKRTVR